MKRKSNLFDTIVEIDNLALAAHKAFKGKTQSIEVLEFRKNFLENIIRLREEIASGEIVIGNYNHFVIYEPKKRLICAAPLRQRILHHAIMNVCHDVFDRQLIYDCYASRPLKGTHKAIQRVKEKALGYRYFVKLDIRRFFDSIDHFVLKNLLRRILKDIPLLGLFDRIIDSYGNDRGLPIGNLTSQYLANYYLSPLDHYMKEEMKAVVYVRYMDDVIIMANAKPDLMFLTTQYCKFAAQKLKLEVKPPIVGLTCRGIPFLGYKIFRERILMNGKGKRRFKKNVFLLNRLFCNCRISEREYASRLSSNLVYAEYADSRTFRERIFC